MDSVLDQLGYAPDARGHHRKRRLHVLQHGERAALPGGARHRDVERGEQVGHVVSQTQEVHHVAETELVDERLGLSAIGPFAGDEHAQAGKGGSKLRGCADEDVGALLGAQPGHGADHRRAAIDPELRAHVTRADCKSWPVFPASETPQSANAFGRSDGGDPMRLATQVARAAIGAETSTLQSTHSQSARLIR